MINKSWVALAAAVIMSLPMQQTSGNDAGTHYNWWGMLYPQFSGGELPREDEDISVEFKILDIIKNNARHSERSDCQKT